MPLAQHLAGDLLPSGRLLGWMHGNLAGFPVFQPYFPLPFLLVSALAPALGLAAAFNLTTALGSLLLPLAAYAAFRLLGAAFPAPALAAVSTLPFLLSTSQSVWGGNLLSTLAGEFAYSLGLAGALVFLGLAWRDLRSGRPAAASALLLAVVGLTHGYPWLFALAASGALLLAAPARQALAFLARLHGASLAVLAFWLAPALAYRQHGTPYRDLWELGWREALPPIVWPWVALAAAFGVARLMAAARSAGQERSAQATSDAGATAPLLLGIGFALLLYRAAYGLGLVDVRFLPFAQLALVLLAVPPVAAAARRLRAAWLVPLIALAATALWVERSAATARGWAVWNYSGFEAKPGWGAFAELNRRLAGGPDEPRVAWEHAPAYEETGTIRAFESLPRFAGRGTLEGLYIQSSPNSPAIFFLQSQISRLGSCPFPDYHCGQLDPEGAAPRLRLFNARQVIVRSAEAKAAFRAAPSFRPELAVGPYEVFRLADPAPGYVEPLAWAPVMLGGEMTPARWRFESYRWFERAGPDEVLLVRPAGAAAAALGDRAVLVPELPDAAPRVSLDAAGVVASAELGSQSVRLRTNRPGHPLLLKVSYHPRWRADDGSPILEVAPALMLVLPRHETVELGFATPAWMRAAGALSAGTVAALVVVLLRRRRPSDPAPAAVAADRVTRRLRLAVGLLAAAGPLVAVAWRPADPQTLLARAQAARREAGCGVAGPAYARVVAAAPSSYPALEARLEQGRCAFEAEDWQAARDLSHRFVVDYPAHPFSAEAQRWLTESRKRLEDSANGGSAGGS